MDVESEVVSISVDTLHIPLLKSTIVPGLTRLICSTKTSESTGVIDAILKEFLLLMLCIGYCAQVGRTQFRMLVEACFRNFVLQKVAIKVP